jgi:hypothetical protein
LPLLQRLCTGEIKDTDFVHNFIKALAKNCNDETLVWDCYHYQTSWWLEHNSRLTKSCRQMRTALYFFHLLLSEKEFSTDFCTRWLAIHHMVQYVQNYTSLQFYIFKDQDTRLYVREEKNLICYLSLKILKSKKEFTWSFILFFLLFQFICSTIWYFTKFTGQQKFCTTNLHLWYDIIL